MTKKKHLSSAHILAATLAGLRDRKIYCYLKKKKKAEWSRQIRWDLNYQLPQIMLTESLALTSACLSRSILTILILPDLTALANIELPN